MFSALLPELDINQLKLDLYDNYQIEVPILRWNDQALIRVSIQAYNNQTDTDKLLSALSNLLPQ
jgi:selenocysteine lyase/cysteine desulfurase